MNNKIFSIAILALSMILAPMVAATSVYATSNGNGGDNGNSILKDKPDGKEDGKDKPMVCKVKVQVKVLNAINGTVYIAQLDDLLPQSKQASFNQTEIDEGDDNVAFNFQYKKGGDSCPAKGDIEEGNVNGLPFAVVINSLTKMNKVGVDFTP